MCHDPSCLSVSGYLFLIPAFVASGVSFSAPFWIRYPRPIKYNVTWRGLWADCTDEPKCAWFWQDDFQKETALPDWHIASQCIFALALVMFLLAIVVQTFNFCCRCCSMSSCCSTTIGSFTLTAAVLTGLALAIFAGFSFQTQDFSDRIGGKLAWAFFSGVGGGVTAIFASVLFFSDGCRKANVYRGYAPAGSTVSSNQSRSSST